MRTKISCFHSWILFCRKIMLYIVTTISTNGFFAKFVLELVLNTSLSIISPTKVAINNILPWNAFPYWFFEVNLSVVLKLNYRSTVFHYKYFGHVSCSFQFPARQADERGFPTKVSWREQYTRSFLPCQSERWRGESDKFWYIGLRKQWNTVNTVTNGPKKLAVLTGWPYYRDRLKFHDLMAEMTIHRTSHSPPQVHFKTPSTRRRL